MEAFGELVGIGLLVVVILLASILAAVVGAVCFVLWRSGWFGRQCPQQLAPLQPDGPPPPRMETTDIQADE